MATDDLYHALRCFARGTYLTIFEQIHRENPALSPREYHAERNFREKVQRVGGAVEFVLAPVVATLALSDEFLRSPVSGLVGVVFLLDSYSRIYSYCGVIPNMVRMEAKHFPPEGYFAGKW